MNENEIRLGNHYSLPLGKPFRMALKIFFSHTWADKAGANLKILVNALKESNHHHTWIDRYEMDVSDDIQASVEAGIKDCDVVVVAWSRNASENVNVAFELETAKKFKKTIIPCIIDGFPTKSSKLVKDLKWIELKADQRHDIPQLTFLNDFLIKCSLKKMDASIEDENLKQQAEELKQKHKSSSDLLRELEDIHHRQKLGVSGNEASDIYVRSALEQAMNVSSMGSNDKIREFFRKMMDATMQFPGKENDQRKTEYLLQTLLELDPDQADPEFQKFCNGGLGAFGLSSDDLVELRQTRADTSKIEHADSNLNSQLSGNFYDNKWFGVRLDLGEGKIEESYSNGCKVNFPKLGIATIYFLYNFHDDINGVADFLNGCITRMRSQGTQAEVADNFDINQGSIALEMAYYNNNGQLQYEYLGGYCLNDHRGFMMEIITGDQGVTKLFRDLFGNSVYLLDEPEPGDKADEDLFKRLANRKLLSISSSSSGYGSFYSSSSDQKHFKLLDNGQFDYYCRATNYSSGLGGLNNESSGFGRWGVYTENSQSYMWFKWNEGAYELCEMRFGNDGDLFLGNAKYFIVSLDYRM